MADEEREHPEDAGGRETAGGTGFGTESDESPDEGGEAGGAPSGAPGGKATEDKANTLNRVIARFIDILIALLLAKLPGYVGFLAGLTYVGIADGLFDGQSIGKRIIGLRALRESGRSHCDFRDSILRNSTIGVYYALFHIPLLGWAFAVVGLGFEWLLVVGNAEGMRLGDEIAGTVVADEPRQEID